MNTMLLLGDYPSLRFHFQLLLGIEVQQKLNYNPTIYLWEPTPPIDVLEIKAIIAFAVELEPVNSFLDKSDFIAICPGANLLTKRS